MPTYLVTWNPKKWHWRDFDAEIKLCREQGFLESGWSCANRHVNIGDRVFLLRQAEEPKGIVGSGYASSVPYENDHWDVTRKGEKTWYVGVRFDVLLDPAKEKILPRASLSAIPLVHWDTQSSGILIKPDAAAQLEQQWSRFLSHHGLSPIIFSEEIPEADEIWEGALRKISINAYERNPRAREACIAHYGMKCAVCGFSFADFYGEMGEGYTHVHHLKPLATVGETYKIDPVKDLRPVCPNCHAMIHRNKEALTIDELRKKIADRRAS